MRGGWVYILANRKHGALYTGVTSDIAARMVQHREGMGSAFCKQYGISLLVHVEWHDLIEDAIRREKAIKRWRRAWKIELIESANPGGGIAGSSLTVDVARPDGSGDGSPLSRG